MGRDSLILESMESRDDVPRRPWGRWIALGGAVVVVLGVIYVALSSLLAADPEDELKTAQAFRAAGDNRAAIDALRAVVAADPDNVAARVELARTYLAFELGVLAKNELEPLRGTPVWAAEYEYDWFRARFFAGEADAVIRHYSSGDVVRMTSRERVLFARAYFDRGLLDRAASTFRSVLRESPEDVSALAGLVGVDMARGNRESAEKWLTQAIAAGPRSAEVKTREGQYAFSIGDLERAKAAYSVAVELDGDIARPRLGLVRTYLALGELEAAQAALSELDALYAGAPPVIMLKAVAAVSAGDYTRAAENITDLLQVTPDDPQAQLLAASVAYQQARHTEALELLDGLVKKAPTAVRPRQLLGATHLAVKAPNAAIRALRPARRVDPFNPVTLSLLGEAYLMKGDSFRARPLLERAIQSLAPDDAALVRTRMALERLASGALDDAAKQLAEAGRLDPTSGSAGLVTAFLKLQAGEGKAAADIAGRLSEGHTGRPGAIALNVKGVALEQAGDLDGARAAYEKAIGLASDYVHPSLNLARMERAAGNVERADEIYAELLRVNPEQPDALLALSRYAYVDGDLGGSMAFLEKARLANPQNVSVRIAQLRLLMKRGSPKDARIVAEELLVLAPKRIDVIREVAEVRFSAGARREAIALMSSAHAQFPDDLGIAARLAEFKQAAGDDAGARAILTGFLERRPKVADAWVARGRLALAKRDFKAAERDSARALATDPAALRAQLFAGDVAVAQKKYRLAITRFKSATGSDPTGLSHIKLGHAYALAGQLPAAEGTFRARLKSAPSDQRARLSLAALLAKLGKTAPAIQLYDDVIKASPDNVAAMNNLAVIYQRAGQVDKGLALAEKAYQLAPEDIAVADTYGWLLLSAGRVPESVSVLGAAVRAAPGLAEVRYHHGVALARSGDKKNAARALRRALDQGLSDRSLRTAANAELGKLR